MGLRFSRTPLHMNFRGKPRPVFDEGVDRSRAKTQGGRCASNVHCHFPKMTRREARLTAFPQVFASELVAPSHHLSDPRCVRVSSRSSFSKTARLTVLERFSEILLPEPPLHSDG